MQRTRHHRLLAGMGSSQRQRCVKLCEDNADGRCVVPRAELLLPPAAECNTALASSWQRKELSTVLLGQMCRARLV